MKLHCEGIYLIYICIYIYFYIVSYVHIFSTHIHKDVSVCMSVCVVCVRVREVLCTTTHKRIDLFREILKCFLDNEIKIDR